MSKKKNARRRSRKYLESLHGKKKKRELNRARYDQTMASAQVHPLAASPAPSDSSTDPWSDYLQLFLEATTKEKVSIEEIEQLENKLLHKSRSHGLDST
jgi:hypothetical protein